MTINHSYLFFLYFFILASLGRKRMFWEVFGGEGRKFSFSFSSVPYQDEEETENLGGLSGYQEVRGEV